MLAILLALLALPGFGADSATTMPNVVLFTVDTLRADHLSCYGYHLRTSPNIDKLAAEGVRFEQAHTVIPLTGPAHISLMTSRYPQDHGARINGLSQRDDARLIFLPSVLRKFGYRNAAFVSAWPLTSRLTHLDDWFDVYDEDMPRKYQMFASSRYAQDVTPRAIEWLESNTDRPFFLWVHYFDPHSPYHLRKDFANPEQIGAPPAGRPPMNQEMRERVQKYDSEIGYADHYIGKLLGTLDDLGLTNNTLVMLMADHGESLGEHDYVGHGRHLYKDIVRIPLIMRLPGYTTPGKVVEREVSLLDVAPTVIDLTVRKKEPNLKLPVPFAGRSLAHSLNGGGEPDEETVRYVTFGGKKGFFPRILTTFWMDMDSLPLKMGHTLGPRKVIWTPRETRLEVFNVTADPFELKPAKIKAKAPQYKIETARLRRWFEETAGEEGKNEMTDKDLEVLKSLGYIQ